jgi:hypothetical protein
VRRTRNVAPRELSLDLGESRIEIGRTRQHLALIRGPRADLAAARARREVLVGFRIIDLLDRALDANLDLERLPMERERSARIRGKLTSLPAAQIGVEYEPAVVHRLEEHESRRRLPVASDSRQRHRRGLGKDRAVERLRGGQQRAKMLNRVHAVAGA